MKIIKLKNNDIVQLISEFKEKSTLTFKHVVNLPLYDSDSASGP